MDECEKQWILGRVEPGGWDSLLIIVTKGKADFALSPSFTQRHQVCEHVCIAFMHWHLQNSTSPQADSVPAPACPLSPAAITCCLASCPLGSETLRTSCKWNLKRFSLYDKCLLPSYVPWQRFPPPFQG